MPLHFASQNAHAKVAKLLVEGGAPLGAQNKVCARLPRAHLKYAHSHTVRAAQLGYTPLLIASAKGHVEVARVLIEEGAPLDAKDMVRARPVRPALSHAHTYCARRRMGTRRCTAPRQMATWRL